MPPLTKSRGSGRQGQPWTEGIGGHVAHTLSIQHLQTRQIYSGRSWHVEMFLSSISLISGKEVTWHKG